MRPRLVERRQREPVHQRQLSSTSGIGSSSSGATSTSAASASSSSSTGGSCEQLYRHGVAPPIGASGQVTLKLFEDCMDGGASGPICTGPFEVSADFVHEAAGMLTIDVMP